ncbi:hypothetical protein QEW_1180 [Clostridioides difficile CD160]|nr:hypothetical protein QEW_1180 [Clostridioides difficile CD160]
MYFIYSLHLNCIYFFFNALILNSLILLFIFFHLIITFLYFICNFLNLISSVTTQNSLLVIYDNLLTT